MDQEIWVAIITTAGVLGAAGLAVGLPMIGRLVSKSGDRVLEQNAAEHEANKALLMNVVETVNGIRTDVSVVQASLTEHLAFHLHSAPNVVQIIRPNAQEQAAATP